MSSKCVGGGGEPRREMQIEDVGGPIAKIGTEQGTNDVP